MAIAMFLITAAIVASFIIVSLNDTETEVKEFADPIADQISRLDSISKRDQYLASKRGSSINITIFDSNGNAVGDTSDKELKYQSLSFDEQIEVYEENTPLVMKKIIEDYLSEIIWKIEY